MVKRWSDAPVSTAVIPRTSMVTALGAFFFFAPYRVEKSREV